MSFRPSYIFTNFYLRPVLASVYFRCLHLVCACMYLSVLPRASLCNNSSPIQARITKFWPQVQITWTMSLLFWRVIGSDLQGLIELENQILLNFELPCVISLQCYGVPNWTRIHRSKMTIPFDFGLDNHWASIWFLIVKPIFLPNWASPHYDPSPIHVVRLNLALLLLLCTECSEGQIPNSLEIVGWVCNNNVAHRNHWTVECQ